MSNSLSFFEYKNITTSPIYLVECKTPEHNKIFRDTINKYHSYVKYSDSPTRNIRWLIYESVSGNHIGAIGISSAICAITCRDEFIGWDKESRKTNLGMIANNSRCCFIQKNITIKNAGSQVLKLMSSNAIKRWKEKYNQPLVLLETFVQPDRESEYAGSMTRTGAIYKASNWIEVGKTSGNSIRKGPLGLWKRENTTRGELARTNPQAALEKYGYAGGKEYIVTKSPIKIMFVKPLVWNWKKLLTSHNNNGP